MAEVRFANSNSLKPCRIRCYHYNKAFRVGFNSPQIKRLQADSVIVRIDFDDGTSGFGESAPRPYVTGEDCLSVVDLIRNRFAPILFSRTVCRLSEAESVLMQLERTCREHNISHYLSALGAVDLALIDALERSQRLAPKDLFPICHRSELRFSASIPFLPQSIIEIYFPLLSSHLDIAVLKVLVGKDVDANLARVKLIRRLAGEDAELRLEFNGKMSFEGVRKNLNCLKQFNIRAVEQPLPPRQIGELIQLRDMFDLDFVADESLVSLDDARALVHSGAYSIFNIKVSKCGGMLRSKAICELAQTQGIRCQIGTHVGESQLLTHAGRRLARSIPNFDCYGGGSEVLFSRLFDAPPQQTAVNPFSSMEGNRRGLKDCHQWVSRYRLLMDLHSERTHPTPCI